MAWVAPVVMAATSVYSAYQSKRAGDKAESQAEQASATAAQANEANQQLADIALAQWKRYLKAFAPLENQLVKEAQAPVEKQPGFGRLMATINRGYTDLEGNVKRSMGGRYPSGSGLERQAVRNVKLQKTTAKAGAVADVMQERFDRMLQAANIGRNLPGQSISGTAAASSGSTSTGGLYGTLSNMYGQAAKSGWESAGTSLGNLMQLINGTSGGSTQQAWTNNENYYYPANSEAFFNY